MSWAQKETITLVTAADGSATGYSTKNFTGQVINVIYTKSTYTDGVDFTITGEDSGINIWTELNVNASEVHSPVQPATLNTGVDSVLEHNPVFVAQERIKIALTGAGNGTTGSFTIITA